MIKIKNAEKEEKTKQSKATIANKHNNHESEYSFSEEYHDNYEENKVSNFKNSNNKKFSLNLNNNNNNQGATNNNIQQLNFENLKRADFNDEFIQNYEEFSPSWRKECDKINLKKKKGH